MPNTIDWMSKISNLLPVQSSIDTSSKLNIPEGIGAQIGRMDFLGKVGHYAGKAGTAGRKAAWNIQGNFNENLGLGRNANTMEGINSLVKNGITGSAKEFTASSLKGGLSSGAANLAESVAGGVFDAMGKNKADPKNANMADIGLDTAAKYLSVVNPVAGLVAKGANLINQHFGANSRGTKTDDMNSGSYDTSTMESEKYTLLGRSNRKKASKKAGILDGHTSYAANTVYDSIESMAGAAKSAAHIGKKNLRSLMDQNNYQTILAKRGAKINPARLRNIVKDIEFKNQQLIKSEKNLINNTIKRALGGKLEGSIDLKDFGKDPFVFNIEEYTEENKTFLTTLWTGDNMQVTVMSLKSGEDIGLETHEGDQFIRVEKGSGYVEMGDSKDDLDFTETIEDDFAILIPAGKWHNIVNDSNEAMKLYAIYAPVEHEKDSKFETKAEAEKAEKEPENRIARAQRLAHLKTGGSVTLKEKEEIIEEVVEEKKNVIPEGAFHSRKNHIHEDYAEHVTHKGIPVVTKDADGKVTQHAEVERNEIIFHKEATDTMESLYKKWSEAKTDKEKDELSIECGKYVANQILTNTDDRTGIIKTV